MLNLNVQSLANLQISISIEIQRLLTSPVQSLEIRANGLEFIMSILDVY